MVWRWRLPRHPEVFVRELSMAEGQRLQKITRTARDPIRLRRATVVLMSAQGQAVGDIVDLLHVDEGYVRDVIHAFNQRGFDALDPKWSGGRPAAVDATTRQQILAMAKADPPSLGLPFATDLPRQCLSSSTMSPLGVRTSASISLIDPSVPTNSTLAHTW